MISQYATVDQGIVSDLIGIVGEHNVTTTLHERAIRAAVPCPFPIHRWEEHLPDVVVLPGSTEEVSEILKLANRHRIPIVPRAAGTGLNDGAVPLRKGILLDIKRLDQVLELDDANMTVTIQTGINNQELSRTLKRYGFWWPFDPASFPVSTVGGNIGTGAWSLIGGVSGHIPDLVLSMKVVLPTGRIIEVGESGARKIRKSSTGYRLKDLFIGHQGTLGVVTEATLDMFPRPEAEFPAFFGYDSFEKAWKNLRSMSRAFLRTMAMAALLDEERLEFLRRDDEAYIALPKNVRSVIGTVFYGSEAEVTAASEVLFKLVKEGDGLYLGEEFSEGNWAGRHETLQLPLHGRTMSGDVMPSTWHVQDAAVLYSELPAVREKWHSLVREYQEKYAIFDDGGIIMHTNSPYRPWGDYILSMDLFMPEMELDDTKWKAFLELDRKMGEVALQHNGSITACHGATRPGVAELIPIELRNGMYDIMEIIKRAFDPNNIMNPGKFGLDSAYVEETKL
jgi:glycolate oxidase